MKNPHELVLYKDLADWRLLDDADERVVAFKAEAKARRAWKKAYPLHEYPFRVSSNGSYLHDVAFREGAAPSQVRLDAMNATGEAAYVWEIGSCKLLDLPRSRMVTGYYEDGIFSEVIKDLRKTGICPL